MQFLKTSGSKTNHMEELIFKESFKAYPKYEICKFQSLSFISLASSRAWNVKSENRQDQNQDQDLDQGISYRGLGLLQISLVPKNYPGWTTGT